MPCARSIPGNLKRPKNPPGASIGAHSAISLLICACVLLSACAIHSAASTRQPLPAAFDNSTGAPAQWPAQEWYRDFGSEELDAFIDLAVRSNTDLTAARARIVQADARARQAGAAILPSVDA